MPLLPYWTCRTSEEIIEYFNTLNLIDCADACIIELSDFIPSMIEIKDKKLGNTFLSYEHNSPLTTLLDLT